MSEADSYSAVEHLRNGRRIRVRSLRPDDRAGMLAAVERIGPESRQRRFFVTKRNFSEKEIDFFINIDFDKHVALVAELEEDAWSAVAGGGRYIVVGPGQAEMAFMVVDAYQGQGIGTILMRHLAILARDAGLKELIAEVLPENTAMIKLFKKFGFRPGSKRDPGVLHLSLQL